MSKVKVALIGIVLSLLVPVIHVTTLEVNTSYKNSSQTDSSKISFLRQAIQQGNMNVEDVARYSQGNVHVAYWYSYTLFDFLRDFIISMIVYLFLVGVIRLIRSRLLLRNL